MITQAPPDNLLPDPLANDADPSSSGSGSASTSPTFSDMPPLAPIRPFTPRSNLFGDTLSSSGGSDHRMDLCRDSDSDYELLHARAVHARARAAQAIRPSTPPTLLLTAPASPEHASASGATSFASCQSFTSAEMEAVSLHIEQIQTVWTAMRAAARDAAARAHGPLIEL